MREGGRRRRRLRGGRRPRRRQKRRGREGGGRNRPEKERGWRIECGRDVCQRQNVSTARRSEEGGRAEGRGTGNALSLNPLLVLRLLLIVRKLNLVLSNLLVPDVTRITALDLSQVASEDERSEGRAVEDWAGEGEDGGVGRGGGGEPEGVEGLLDGAEGFEDLERRG